MDIIGRKIVITRKLHVCFGCAREFPKGTKMERSCVIDDVVRTDYLCMTCVDISSELESGDMFGYGDLKEEAIIREGGDTYV